MSQISVNLIAISIFLITLTTLLGSIIHLSPFIPALTTFLILGIVTLDSLGLQGKGGTLVIDWLSRFSPEYSDRIVYHEAGHFIIAYLLQIPITGYTLSAWESWKQGIPGTGGVIFADHELTAQLETRKINAQRLDHYCICWMAGIAAEKLVFNSANGGADDMRKLNQVMFSLGFSAELRQQKQRLYLLQAKNLLSQNWSSYTDLVKAMRENSSVEDCQQVIEGKTAKDSCKIVEPKQ